MGARRGRERRKSGGSRRDPLQRRHGGIRPYGVPPHGQSLRDAE